MSVIRVVHNRENPYVQLNKQALWDSNLSLKAVGLWARCMSRPDDWRFSIKELASQSKEGRRAIDGAINELIHNSYAVRLEHWEKSEDGKFTTGGVEYVFFEFPASQEDKQKVLDEFKKSFRHCGFGNCRNGDSRNSNLLIKNTSSLKEEVNTKANKEREAKSPPPPIESHYKEKFENKILITPEQRQRLVDKFGLESIVDSYAEKLYRYSLNRPAAFKKYKRHDLTIEDWIEKDLGRQEEKVPQAVAQPKGASGGKWYLKDLNEEQRKHFEANEELVEELKVECPSKCSGLNFYYKSHTLKDTNNPNFSISGLVDHASFCRVIDKQYKLETYRVRILNEQI